jgi:hypothetical protein
VKIIHLREGIEIDTLYLFETQPTVTLEYITNDGDSVLDTVDSFQTIDVLGAEVCARAGQLYRAGPRKNDLSTQIRGPSLKIVRHAARQSREKHYQTDPQRHAHHAYKGTDGTLANIIGNQIVHVSSGAFRGVRQTDS